MIDGRRWAMGRWVLTVDHASSSIRLDRKHGPTGSLGGTNVLCHKLLYSCVFNFIGSLYFNILCQTFDLT